MLVEIDKDKLYTATEAAKYLQVHPNTVKQWHRACKIAGEQFGNGWIRIPGYEIERVISERRGQYIKPRCPVCGSGCLSEILAAGNGLTCLDCKTVFFLTVGESRSSVECE